MKSDKLVEKAYVVASQQFAELGVDVDAAIAAVDKIAISVHCWQGDDIGGFENTGRQLSGGIAVTGDYPGRATSGPQLRQDLDKALSLSPGAHRINLHAIYAETGGARVERNELQPEHFSEWIDWAKANELGMDFNGTFFSHPQADSGLTLSAAEPDVRKFWIEHGQACRRIGAAMGKAVGSPCVCNLWIPDGSKDVPVDRKAPRERLRSALDDVFAEDLPAEHLLDSLESKLFGIGSESYVVGSHEFYMGYAMAAGKLICLDSGHFHPTEMVSDKLSAVLTFMDEILLHVTRGVRWDSDHVLVGCDELRAIAQEIIRGDYVGRIHIGLDYFDATINRVAAWVIGIRAMRKALLDAMLEPIDLLRQSEQAGDLTTRLALQETSKALPTGAVWDYYCLTRNTPPAANWLADVKTYERDVLAKR